MRALLRGWGSHTLEESGEQMGKGPGAASSVSDSRTLEVFHVIVALPHALDKETHAMHLLLVGVRQREQHLV